MSSAGYSVNSADAPLPSVVTAATLITVCGVPYHTDVSISDLTLCSMRRQTHSFSLQFTSLFPRVRSIAPTVHSAYSSIAFFNSLLASLNIRQLIFSDSSEVAPREGNRAGRPAGPGALDAASKTDLANSLAVHVETTTVHKIDDGFEMKSRTGCRWRPEKTTMEGSPECETDCTDEDLEMRGKSPSIWLVDPNLDIEAHGV
jgi:hypothetical protein